MEKVKKPIYKKWWFWVIIVVVVFAIAAGGSGSDKKDSKKNSVAGTEQMDNKDAKTKDSDAKDAEPEEDLSAVETEYTLGAGYYTAGIDLPVGKCNLTAVSGNGNINSSNLLKGGVNEMFGVDDGNDLYESSFNGLKMKENVVFHISGDVVVQVSYIGSNSYEFMVPYLVMAIIYIVIVLLIGGGIKLMERSLRKSDRRN